MESEIKRLKRLAVLEWYEKKHGEAETSTQLTIRNIVVETILAWEQENGR